MANIQVRVDDALRDEAVADFESVRDGYGNSCTPIA